MSEKCRVACPVVDECRERVNDALRNQQRLLDRRRNLTETAIQTIHVAHPNGALQQITYVAPDHRLQRVERRLRSHEAFIAQVAAGAAEVQFAQTECKAGPQLNLRGKALLSAVTLMQAFGVMHPATYMTEKEELVRQFPQCSSRDAYAALAGVPLVGYRYSE